MPHGQPTGSSDRTFPASRCRRTPFSAPCARVRRSIFDTDEIAASASPRKPSVPMQARSSCLRILLVAWRRNAVRASTGSMPQPSSVMRRKVMPPFCNSIVMFFAPASMEFSTSSLTADAGRSTTSPAAMRSATWRSSWMIFGIKSLRIRSSAAEARTTGRLQWRAARWKPRSSRPFRMSRPARRMRADTEYS